MTLKGAVSSFASPGGKWIYYSKPGGAVWRLPLDGGEETLVLEARSLSSTYQFTVSLTGIYFTGPPDRVSKPGWPLKLYRFADSKTVELGHLDKPLVLRPSVSPDEKWLVYTQLDSSTYDLMLVEHFR